MTRVGYIKRYFEVVLVPPPFFFVKKLMYLKEVKMTRWREKKRNTSKENKNMYLLEF